MTGALVPTRDDLQQIEPAAREAAVTQYLATARDWLVKALDDTGPETIAAVKAEIATAAEATKQLNLSKEIQEDAQEMVRRAEFALGKAIRKGQDEGTVARRGQGGGAPDSHRSDSTISLPTSFATHGELSGQGGQQNGIYGLVDGVEPEQFEAALSEAKAEHNVSRANVVRKIKATSATVAKPDRLARIAEMAATGHNSRQIGADLGLRDGYVRELAREAAITIPADTVTSRTRQLNADRAVSQLVLELDALAGATEFVEPSAVSREHVEEWVNSLSDSLRTLHKFANRLKKELTQQ